MSKLCLLRNVLQSNGISMFDGWGIGSAITHKLAKFDPFTSGIIIRPLQCITWNIKHIEFIIKEESGQKILIPGGRRSLTDCFIRPHLFYLLDYGISSLQKPKSENKKKVPHYHFSPAFFPPPLICVNNKKKFSADHISRAYKSAIPRGRLKCSAVLLLET
jgi:hypothetical protein